MKQFSSTGFDNISLGLTPTLKKKGLRRRISFATNYTNRHEFEIYPGMAEKTETMSSFVSFRVIRDQIHRFQIRPGKDELRPLSLTPRA